MAMNFKTYEISVDLINNTSTTSTIRFSQNDQNSAKLLLNITNKTVEMDLSTVTSVRMSFKKPDGTRVFQDDCQPINPLKGKYQIVLKTQTLAAVGKVIGQVHIEENGRVIDTQKIVFEVDESLSSDDAIESTNEFGIIRKAIEVGEKLEGVDIPALIESKETADAALAKSTENTNQIGILSENTVKKVDMKEEVETKPAHWWSTKLEQAITTVNSKKVKLATRPLDNKKKVILFGSSSTEGTGATYPNSYYDNLKRRLEPLGYEIINRGIGGDNTGGAIARFYTDIVPVNADFIILAFTLGNEGIDTAPDKKVVYTRFKNNIFKLVHMAQQHGMTSVVMTQSPTKKYNAEIYNYAKKMNEELESAFVCIDWGGVIDDLQGQPIASAVADDLHYNNDGHLEISNAISSSLFEKVGVQRGGYLLSPKGYLNTGELVSSNPISCIPDSITTFTAFVRFKKATPVLAAILSFNTDNRLVMEADGHITFVSISAVTQVDSANFADNNWHSVAVSYTPLSKELRIYVDGLFKAKTTLTSNIVFSKFVIGGRDGSSATLKNAEIKDIILYRTRLNDSKIKQIHDGTIHQSSLEIFSPCADKNVFPDCDLINLAPTTANMKIGTGETSIVPIT